MSTNRLGRAENLDQFWQQTHLLNSDSKVELEPAEPDEITPLDEISEYPYSGQDRYCGELTYTFSDWQGNTRTEEGQYEYRAESGLFLLELGSERVDPKKIIQTLNNQMGKSTSINDSISVKRDALWSFVEEADQYGELTITGPEGRFDFNKFKHIAHRVASSNLDGDDSLESLELNATIEEPDALEDVKPLLEKTDLTQEINSIEDLGIKRSKYFIERAELHFEFRDEVLSAAYDRGNLRINDDASDEGREYVTQLFEKEVVFPSYGR